MKKLMLGNEAIARGAYEAGVKVVSSYPGTPSTEITEFVAKYDEIYAEWAPNEKVAAEVALGASLAGARAMCAMKHVGLNVAADPVFTAAYTGVNGGLVIVVADDPGMHSSQNEQDSRNYAKAAKLPMIEPADSRECKDFVKRAFEVSEEFDTPVFIRLTTRIAHSQSIVEPADRDVMPERDYARDPAKYVMMPAFAKKRRAVLENRLKALDELSETCGLNTVEWGSRSLGIITCGISYQYAKEAFGEGASYLKLGMTWPLPAKLIREFAAGVDRLVVVEEQDPFIEEFVKTLNIKADGKNILPAFHEYGTELLKRAIMGGGGDSGAAASAASDAKPVPSRPPVLCSGCPHRAIFHVLKKLNLNVMGDIGCYTLAAAPPLKAMHTCVDMGAGIGMAHGFMKASASPEAAKTVAVIGDSTFMHSGITGLINMVYNKGNSTVFILDNSITGMTGHQENPTTGRTLKGEITVKTDLAALAAAIGVKRVITIDPFDIKEAEATVKEEIQAPEPSVIIVRSPCVLLKNYKRKSPSIIDRSKCRKCRKCIAVGCPAISATESGMEIDAEACNGCTLCNQVCNFNAIERGDI